jgi:hypothetical protein
VELEISAALDHVNTPGELEKLLFAFSECGYHDLLALSNLVWAIARASDFYESDIAANPVFVQTSAASHLIKILSERSLPVGLRIGTTIPLSKVFESWDEQAQIDFASSPALGAAVSVAFEACAPLHVIRAMTFLALIASAGAACRDLLLGAVSLASLCEQALLVPDTTIRLALCQLVAHISYWPMDDEDAARVVYFARKWLSEFRGDHNAVEKAVAVLFYVASTGIPQASLVMDDEKILDWFPVLLKEGSMWTIKTIFKILNLFVDLSDDAVTFDLGMVVEAMFSEAAKIAKAALQLIHTMVVKSADYLEGFVTGFRLFKRLAELLDSAAFEVSIYVIDLIAEIAGFEVPGLTDKIIRANLLAKMPFANADGYETTIRRLLDICNDLFTNCANDSLLVRLYAQFEAAGGEEFLIAVRDNEDFPYLAERAVILHGRIEQLELDQIAGVGPEHLTSSGDDDVVEVVAERRTVDLDF